MLFMERISYHYATCLLVQYYHFYMASPETDYNLYYECCNVLLSTVLYILASPGCPH